MFSKNWTQLLCLWVHLQLSPVNLAQKLSAPGVHMHSVLQDPLATPMAAHVCHVLSSTREKVSLLQVRGRTRASRTKCKSNRAAASGGSRGEDEGDASPLPAYSNFLHVKNTASNQLT